jgi:hypothetical protein
MAHNQCPIGILFPRENRPDRLVVVLAHAMH